MTLTLNNTSVTSELIAKQCLQKTSPFVMTWWCIYIPSTTDTNTETHAHTHMLDSYLPHRGSLSHCDGCLLGIGKVYINSNNIFIVSYIIRIGQKSICLFKPSNRSSVLNLYINQAETKTNSKYSNKISTFYQRDECFLWKNDGNGLKTTYFF